jgi:Zn/Cd-binding protein ZinT
MKAEIHDKIFSGLNLSKEQVLDEIALLSAHQKYAKFEMEVDYFEKKYDTDFDSFEISFREQKATYVAENDWMAWKFAIDGKSYWQNILKEIKH